MVYAALMGAHDDFRYVIYDYTVTLLVILALQAHAGLVRRKPSALWIVGGILVAFAAAVVQRSGEMAGIYLFSRGARLLQDH